MRIPDTRSLLPDITGTFWKRRMADLPWIAGIARKQTCVDLPGAALFASVPISMESDLSNAGDCIHLEQVLDQAGTDHPCRETPPDPWQFSCIFLYTIDR